MFTKLSAEDKFRIASAVLGLEGKASVNGSSEEKVSASEIDGDLAYAYFLREYKDWIAPINSAKADKPYRSNLAEHHKHISYNSNVSNENDDDDVDVNSKLVDNLNESQFRQMLKRKSHGSFLSIDTGWEKHAIGINFVTEEIQKNKFVIHMIVVNKGQNVSERTESKDEFLNKATQCYTFNYPLSETLLKQIYDTCSGKIPLTQKLSGLFRTKGRVDFVRQAFDQLFHSPELIRNPELTEKIPKSFQKASNCGVANQNISMHFNLATEVMRNNPTKGLVECYDETLPNYKQLRIQARKQAFKMLLNLKNEMNEDEWLSLVVQAIGKFASKHERKQRHHPESIFQIIDTPANSESYQLIVSALKERFNYPNLMKKIEERNATIIDKKIELDGLKDPIKRASHEREIATLQASSRILQYPIQAKQELERYLTLKAEKLTTLTTETKEFELSAAYVDESTPPIDHNVSLEAPTQMVLHLPPSTIPKDQEMAKALEQVKALKEKIKSQTTGDTNVLSISINRLELRIKQLEQELKNQPNAAVNNVESLNDPNAMDSPSP